MTEGDASHVAPDGARCAKHPEVVATTVCARCGDYSCQFCTRYGADQVYCQRCLESLGDASRQHYGPASLSQRFFNYLIDIWLGTTIAGAIIGVPLVVVGLESLIEETPDLVFNVMAGTVYYVTLEGLFGRTLGKLVTGTAVIADEGGKPGLKRILGRTLARFVPFEALSFWISDAFWHDSWSRTTVVRRRPPKRRTWSS